MIKSDINQIKLKNPSILHKWNSEGMEEQSANAYKLRLRKKWTEEFFAIGYVWVPETWDDMIGSLLLISWINLSAMLTKIWFLFSFLSFFFFFSFLDGCNL